MQYSITMALQEMQLDAKHDEPEEVEFGTSWIHSLRESTLEMQNDVSKCLMHMQLFVLDLGSRAVKKTMIFLSQFLRKNISKHA